MRGGGKEKRWILQPSVKTRKIIIQCSSSSFPSREFSFCLGKRLTVRVLLLQLILLCCKRVVFFFPLHLSGQQMLEKNKWNVCPPDVTCRTRVILYFYNHRGLACFRRSVGLRRGKEQGITVLIIFFFPEKSHQFFNLSAKEM